MGERTSRSIRKADLDRLLQVLRQNGLHPTGAELRPDGTVRVFTDESGLGHDLDNTGARNEADLAIREEIRRHFDAKKI